MHDAPFYKPMVMFYIFMLAGVIVFFVGMYINLRIIFSGRGGKQKTGIIKIARAVLRDVFLQVPILKLSVFRWLVHMMIFWGFAGLFIGTTRLSIYTHLSSRDWVLMGQDIICDICGLMMMTGVCLASLRRYVIPDSDTLTIAEDTLLLLFLFVLSLSGFLVEGARIALTPGQIKESSFAGIWFAGWMKWITPELATVFWVLHGGLSALFVAYIPFSKMWHVFTAPSIMVLNSDSAYATDK